MHSFRPGPLQRIRIIVMATIFSLLAGTGFSIAGEGPGREPAPASDVSIAGPGSWVEPGPWADDAPWPGPVPWAEPGPWAEVAPWPGPVPWADTVHGPGLAPWQESVPPTGYFKAFGKRMDTTHAMLERNILRQIVRFDNYFGSVKPEVLSQTKYDIRWRNSITFEHGKNLNIGTSFRANFALSRISQRLHLFISGEDEPGLSTQSLPEDPGNPGFDRTTPTAHFANTELRYELIQHPRLNIFLGVGVRIALPFEVFARSRLEYFHNLGEISIMRVAETFFVKNTDVLGETTEFSLERLFGKTTLLRWASAGTASEKIEGVEWGSELSLFRELSPRSAITLTGGVYGNSTLSPIAQNYQILARYRRNFLRTWLFYELEPKVSWPINPDRSRPPVFAVTFRLEVGFQGATLR